MKYCFIFELENYRRGFGVLDIQAFWRTESLLDFVK